MGLLTYIYPGNSNGNTTEAYGAATFGPVTAKYSHTLSKDYFAYAGPGRGPCQAVAARMRCATSAKPAPRSPSVT